MSETVRFHPVCEAFPQMDESALGELTADVRAHGLRDSIWRHRDGSIIDGRNRYLACLRSGVVPKYRTYEGADSSLPAFVVSANIQRRHLNESQRAMVAAKLANMKAGRRTDLQPRADLHEVSEVSRAQAAKLLNVCVRSVVNARAVVEKGVPELAQAVERGEVAVTVAAAVAKLPKEKQKAAITQAARHPIHRRRHAPRADRIVAGVVTALEGVCASIDGVKTDAIDKGKASEWSASIVSLTGEIRKFARRLI